MTTLAFKQPDSGIRWLILGALLFAVLFGLAARLWRHPSRLGEADVLFEPKLRIVEAAPLCPWREPEADRVRFFPGSTRCEAVTFILSDRRLELQKRLGRVPGPEENALTMHRVYRGDNLEGAVVTRRVKGEHGAIELVLATDDQRRVRGVRLQRLREPETVAKALTDPAWLASFEGRDGRQAFQLGNDIPDLPAEARLSAQALCDGVRSLLISEGVASASASLTTGHPHAHAVR